MKWPNEWNSMCCSSGKVALPDYPEPPDCIKSLLTGENERSVVFRKHIRQLNNALSLASIKIGNTSSQIEGFAPTVFIHVSVSARILIQLAVFLLL